MEKEEYSNSGLLRSLIANNIALQKKMISLIEATHDLNKRMDKILMIFEEASKHIGETQITEDKIRELYMRLESLLEQNKDIAKALVLLEEYVRNKSGIGQEFKPKPFTQNV